MVENLSSMRRQNQCRHLIIACFVCVFTNLLYGGSFYSSKGIGLVSDFISGRSVGMGGIGLSLTETFTVNYLNPASLVAVPITTLSGTFNHVNTSLKNATQDAVINETNIGGFQFVVPLTSNRAAFSLGVNPYSSIEYTFSSQDSVGALLADQEIEGDGGLNTAFVSFSVRPFNRLYLGVTGLLYFGRLRTLHRANFNSTIARNTQVEVARNLSAGGVRLGVVYHLTEGWTIGGIYSPRVKLKSDRVVTLIPIVEFSDFVDQNLDVPLTVGFGTSARLFGKLLVGADYLRQNWSAVESSSYVNDSQRFGVGAEYFPRGSRLDSYWSRVAYRAGFYYKNMGLEDPLGEKVTEFFGSLGLGLPVKWSAARIDLALEAGRRGSISRNPFRENIVRFTATISVGERWFFRGGPR
jgi:long-subunit fatty acid transport protein